MNQTALHRKLASKDLKDLDKVNPHKLFDLRVAANLPLIEELFYNLYSDLKHSRYFKELQELLPSLFQRRPDELKIHDLQLLRKGNWYQSEKMVGMQLYVDLFNKNLKGIEEKIPYFKELGINFLHLMPITTRPKGENDGGYAVNSYTAIAKRYGSKKILYPLQRNYERMGSI